MDEESFMSAFEEVKRVNIYSGRALAEELTKIRETLSKSSNDWKVSLSKVTLQKRGCAIRPKCDAEKMPKNELNQAIFGWLEVGQNPLKCGRIYLTYYINWRID